MGWEACVSTNTGNCYQAIGFCLHLMQSKRLLLEKVLSAIASGQGMGAEMFNASMAEERICNKDDKQKCSDKTSGRALIDGFVPAVFPRETNPAVLGEWH
ncbi:hypothetical protein NC652_004857 [Populus alba x Populus x berolinensis]|nr:hypothetical protein NC652_004857 [Populus alba x Populus x berolinensis]